MQARLVLQLAHDEGGAPAHVALGHVDVGEYVVSCRGGGGGGVFVNKCARARIFGPCRGGGGGGVCKCVRAHEYVVSCRGSSVNKFVCAHCEYVTRDSERPRTLDAEDRRLRAFGPSRRRESREPAAVPLDSDQALG